MPGLVTSEVTGNFMLCMSTVSKSISKSLTSCLA